MHNQHLMISGYRDLTQAEVNLINEIKVMANMTSDLINKMEKMNQPRGIDAMLDLPPPRPSERWMAIAKTDLQKGHMALVRSVAKPEGF